MRSLAEVKQYVEDENVKFIRLSFVDVYGRMRNIAVMPEELDRAFVEGVAIDASAVPGYGELEKSDLFVIPEAETISIVPWRPIDGRVARMFCEVRHPNGDVLESDPRYILKRIVRKAKASGLTVNIGAEVEFYLFRLDEFGGMTKMPHDNAGYMDIFPDDQAENIRREICFALTDMGIQPEASHHEQGPGQNEVDFVHANALRAADNTTVFKWVVKSVAQSNGVGADFSPKPMPKEPGNGMHVNLSLERTDGADPFPAFMAGILDHIAEITLFLDPVKASYERLGEQKAPKYISWAKENRTQLIRIPAVKNEQKRMEVRSPDPCANPYLAYALLIAAGLDGIERGLTPPEPCDVNLYTAGSDVTAGLSRLPERIEQAARLAEDSAFVRSVLPERVIRAYTQI